MKTAIICISVALFVLFVCTEFFYESILNTKVVRKYAKKMNLYDDTLINLFRHNEVYNGAMKWFVKQKTSDTVIKDAKGKDVHGHVIRNEAESHKWAICAHGHICTPSMQAPFAQHFYEKGYNVVCPSMRGHGDDTHRYCSMGWYDKDIVIAWINYIVENDPDSEIVLHGVSMGAATVMLVTGEKIPSNVKCAVSDCGFSSCKEQFAHVMKTRMKIPFFPLYYTGAILSWLRGNFYFSACMPVKAVASSETPTLFIHGTADDIVPYRMLDDVYNACSAEKERLDIPDATHAVALSFDPELYFSVMDKFTENYIT